MPRPVPQDVQQSPDSGAMTRAAPEMAEVLAKLKALGAKPVHTLSVDAARTQPSPADAVGAILSAKSGKPFIPEPVGKIEDIKVKGAAGDLDARVYWPMGAATGTPLPVIVYFHGGGWVIANIDTYDASTRALANETKAIVVSVHYRQAPENKFPAAYDDAVAAYKDIVENAGKWNGDSKHIAVAGESAGGNLALNVAMAARDLKLTMPLAVLAVYPVASGETDTQSEIENQNAMPLSQGDILWFVDKYLQNPGQAKDPRINIVGDDLKGLPPVTIVSAEIDPLLSDGMMLRDALKKAGNDVAWREWNGVTHEFFGMGGLVPQAKQAEDFAGGRLRDALSTKM